jgi:hypothetical protein
MEDVIPKSLLFFVSYYLHSLDPPDDLLQPAGRPSDETIGRVDGDGRVGSLGCAGLDVGSSNGVDVGSDRLVIALDSRSRVGGGSFGPVRVGSRGGSGRSDRFTRGRGGPRGGLGSGGPGLGGRSRFGSGGVGSDGLVQGSGGVVGLRSDDGTVDRSGVLALELVVTLVLVIALLDTAVLVVGSLVVLVDDLVVIFLPFLTVLVLRRHKRFESASRLLSAQRTFQSMLTSSSPSWFSPDSTTAPDPEPDPVETAAPAETVGEALDEGLPVATKFCPATEVAAGAAPEPEPAPAVTVTYWVTVTGPDP